MKWLKSLGISCNDWNFVVHFTLSAWTGLENKRKLYSAVNNQKPTCVSFSLIASTLYSLKMTYLELSVYPRTTYHHHCLMISFQLLCRYRSIPRHLDCDAATFWGKGRGQECLTDQAERMVFTLWAASWQHRGHCCFASSYGGQGQVDPRKI